jgi:hypothetical protein
MYSGSSKDRREDFVEGKSFNVKKERNRTLFLTNTSLQMKETEIQL